MSSNNLGIDSVLETDHLENHGSPDIFAVGGHEITAYGCRISNENPYGRTVGGHTFFTPGGGVGCFHS